jgi:beta-glucosidase/6-phospho-beta-glucosidase/beta-galactosidase
MTDQHVTSVILSFFVQSSSTMGFIFGAYPPGQLLGLETAGEALLNMLRAHTAAYRAIKALPSGERHKVGGALQAGPVCLQLLPADNCRVPNQ